MCNSVLLHSVCSLFCLVILLYSCTPVVFAMGVYDSGKTWLIRMIHPSIFIHMSNHLSASLLLRGEQQTCCCSLQLRGLAWIVLETVCWSTGWVVGSGERVRERERERSKQSLLTLTLGPGLSRAPDRPAGSLTFLRFRAHSRSYNVMAQVDQHLIIRWWWEIFWLISNNTANDWQQDFVL